MPVPVPSGSPTIVIRRAAFERAGLTRAQFDTRFNLTDEEFRVEGQLVVVGPLVGDDALDDLIAELEETGLTHFEDFFDLSGNWPDWLTLYAGGG